MIVQRILPNTMFRSCIAYSLNTMTFAPLDSNYDIRNSRP